VGEIGTGAAALSSALVRALAAPATLASAPAFAAELCASGASVAQAAASNKKMTCVFGSCERVCIE
jgi:hypothetical protein